MNEKAKKILPQNRFKLQSSEWESQIQIRDKNCLISKVRVLCYLFAHLVSDGFVWVPMFAPDLGTWIMGLRNIGNANVIWRLDFCVGWGPGRGTTGDLTSWHKLFDYIWRVCFRNLWESRRHARAIGHCEILILTQRGPSCFGSTRWTIFTVCFVHSKFGESESRV